MCSIYICVLVALFLRYRYAILYKFFSPKKVLICLNRRYQTTLTYSKISMKTFLFDKISTRKTAWIKLVNKILTLFITEKFITNSEVIIIIISNFTKLFQN